MYYTHLSQIVLAGKFTRLQEDRCGGRRSCLLYPACDADMAWVDVLGEGGVNVVGEVVVAK